MPIVVNQEQWERLQKVINKPPTKFNYQTPSITKRYLFLRYTIGGKPRAKRIEIRKQFGDGVWSWQMKEIAEHRTSKLLKKTKQQGFAIALVDSSHHLEPLLKKLLGHLKADPGELDYHWDDDVE